MKLVQRKGEKLMLKTFEEFTAEDLMAFETEAYPSLFELVCLFPIAGKSCLSDSSFLFDNIDIL